VLAKHGHGFVVEGDASLLMRLGVAADPLAIDQFQPRADVHQPTVEVDVVPSEGAQLSAPRSRCHGCPDEGAPVRVLGRILQQARGFLGRRR